jgi:hypothetical protein
MSCQVACPDPQPGASEQGLVFRVHHWSDRLPRGLGQGPWSQMNPLW